MGEAQGGVRKRKDQTPTLPRPLELTHPSPPKQDEIGAWTVTQEKFPGSLESVVRRALGSKECVPKALYGDTCRWGTTGLQYPLRLWGLGYRVLHRLDEGPADRSRRPPCGWGRGHGGAEIQRSLPGRTPPVRREPGSRRRPRLRPGVGTTCTEGNGRIQFRFVLVCQGLGRRLEGVVRASHSGGVSFEPPTPVDSRPDRPESSSGSKWVPLRQITLGSLGSLDGAVASWCGCPLCVHPRTPEQVTPPGPSLQDFEEGASPVGGNPLKTLGLRPSAGVRPWTREGH